MKFPACFSVFLAFAVVLSGLFTSCSRYYAPPAQNIPLLSKAHEIQVNPGLSTNGPYGSLAVSPLPHLGISGSAITNWGNKNWLNYGEIAAGYYSRFHHGINFEIYCGYGTGHSAMDDSLNRFMRKKYYAGHGSFGLGFIQTNAGLNLDSVVYIAAGLRYVPGFIYRADHIRLNDEIYHHTEFSGKGLELVYQMKVGYKALYLLGGGSLSLMNVEQKYGNDMFRVSPFLLYAGLVLKLDYR
ncbi:MAG: hypothetical protein AB9842_05015 [Bacteroidales bacterium]